MDELRAGLVACGIDRAPLLLAVSGGADSVALLRGIADLAADSGLRVSAAHLDHGLRGEQSRLDAEWTAALCDRLAVPCEVAHEDLATFARSAGLGIETAARQRRYEFLTSAAERAGCGLVAVGHTADDQAETILHRIVRGTGLTGLRGMPRRRRLSGRVELVRPLLDIRRRVVREWLDAIGQGFREDSSNVDDRFTRNRIRHQLIPLLECEFNPEAIAAVLRLGGQAAEAEDAVSDFARGLLDQAVLDRSSNTCRIDCRIFAGQQPYLVRQAFRLLWEDLGWPLQAMGHAEWDRLAALVSGMASAAALPGRIQAVRRGELLVLTR